MGLKEGAVHDLTLRLFRMESDRDRQKKVGASQISDPCSYHLAKALTNQPETPSKYWLGGKIGTATHLFIESCIEKADLSDFPELEGAWVEQKIELGELPGYGAINSKPDLVLVSEGHLIDWKTSTRAKMKKLQKAIDTPDTKDTASVYTIQKYMAQAQLYAWGLNKAGVKIDGLSLVFINRDGTTEHDIWNLTFDYSEEFALAVWTRLENLWTKIQNGLDLETLDRNEDCFKCSMGI